MKIVYLSQKGRGNLKKLDSKSDSSDDKVYTQADLFKESGIRRITIFCMYQWFATTLVYYGLSLGAGNLGGDLLVNNLLNGLVEFICYVFLPAFIDIRCIGRKYGIIITMAIGRSNCLNKAMIRKSNCIFQYYVILHHYVIRNFDVHFGTLRPRIDNEYSSIVNCVLFSCVIIVKMPRYCQLRNSTQLRNRTIS